MCLIAFALGVVPGHPLLIASNRDEHLDRPTLALHAWQLPNGTQVAAGRDQHAGGTWLGVTPQGRVAMLTNVRETGVVPAPLSRGELVTAWLQGTQRWDEFAYGLDALQYAGFNLVLGDLNCGRAGGTESAGEWAWITNRQPDPSTARPTQALGSVTGRLLAAGVYGLSNAALDSPWPKTLKLKAALQSVVDSSVHTLPADWRKPLLRTLLDRQQARADALPHTGAPRVWEQALSSPFVDYAERHYGTRSSLLVCASTQEVQMEEWTYDRGSLSGKTLDPTADADVEGDRWPLARSAYRRLCISMCAMPASSNGSPRTA